MNDHARRRLRRARHGRILAGVARGLADFFGIGVLWFRAAFLIALIPGGVPGVGAYLLLWVVIPKERV